MYNDKFIKNKTIIEYIEKETYFYNIHFFVKRVRDLILIKNVEII